MFKFLKYEFKRNYKFNIILLISLLVINVLEFLTSNISFDNDFITFLNKSLVFAINFIPLIVLIKYISNYQKELYEDTGYLTFSLPIKGSKIIFSKIILLFGMGLIISTINLLFAIRLKVIVFKNFDINFSNFTIINFIIFGILFSVFFILSIYFSITITHKFFKSKNKLFIWIFIFFLIMFLFFYFIFYASISMISILEVYNIDYNQTALISSITFNLILLVLNFVLSYITSDILDNHLELN